jgi:hypothetical protein
MLKIHGVQRYRFHRAGTDPVTGEQKKFLDLTDSTLVPAPCASFQEFMDQKWSFPIAFMGAGKDNPILRTDKYFSATPMYARVTPQEFVQLFDNLKPEWKTLSAMVSKGASPLSETPLSA